MAKQTEILSVFDADHIGLSKGALSFVIVITRNLRHKKFPISIDEFKTEKEGQVAGLGGGATKKVLKDYGITRSLSEEGGRTSRGNMGRLRTYLDLLNQLSIDGELDLKAAESYWIERILLYFDTLPFTFKLDPSKSLRACFKHLMMQAVTRQREAKGTMYAGAMMQHLVGAKLEWVSGKEMEHHGFSVADAPSNRAGDFQLGDVAVHVTTAPSEALIRKCDTNLSRGIRPLIITTEDGVGGAKAIARDQGIDDRIDVIDFEQFLAANLYERSSFERDQRREAVMELIERYNKIVAKAETDPSFRIELD